MKKKKERSKRQKIVARIIVLSTALSLVCCALFYLGKATVFLFNSAVSPQEILIDVDLSYSDTLKNNLITCFNEYLSEHSIKHFNIAAFDSYLQTKFNIIKKVECVFVKPAVSKINIIGTKPFCKINNNLVLADNSKLFDVNFFRKEQVSCLHNIIMPHEECNGAITDTLFLFLQHIPEHYWQTYDMTYRKKDEISLCPKIQGKQKVFCLADNSSFFDSTKIDFMHGSDFYSDKHWIRHYIVDTRFKRRVLVRSVNKKTFEQTLNKTRGMG